MVLSVGHHRDFPGNNNANARNVTIPWAFHVENFPLGCNREGSARGGSVQSAVGDRWLTFNGCKPSAVKVLFCCIANFSEHG